MKLSSLPAIKRLALGAKRFILKRMTKTPENALLKHTIQVASSTLTAANRLRATDPVRAAELEANVAAMWVAYNAGTIRF